MHIIGGKYKGKKLKFPKDKQCRPTQQRVREAVFNILQDKVVGAGFLDLCCGTGAMGLEALSRGAKSVTLVDKNITFSKKNFQEIEDRYDIVKADIRQFLKKQKESYNIVFFDPPWDQFELYSYSLNAMFESDILLPKGVLVYEHRKGIELTPQIQNHQKQYQYGDTLLSVIYYE